MKTLICVRDLPHAAATIHFGGLMAGVQRSPVTLMTVMTGDDTEAEVEHRLAQARDLIDAETVEMKTYTGDPATEILREVEAHDHNLIVVGARTGMSVLRSLFARPVARRVAKEARVCVLIVNQDRVRLGRILICTAGELDDDVITVGTRVARAAGADVTLLHVANPVPSMYTGLGAMEESLEELLQTDTPVASHLRKAARYLAEENVGAELQLRHGVAQDEILREAKKGDYDLIVIGPGPLSGSLRNLVMDNVTSQVVDHAPCPVLVVRGGCV